MHFLALLLGILPVGAAHDCFNCAAGGECLHFGACNNYTGLCACPPGFGGADCKQPTCGSLAAEPYRPVRAVNTSCECSDGWSGVNCNMCDSHSACEPFMPVPGIGDAHCYTGGLLIENNFHMCAVTNRKILDVLAGRDAAVTFGCERNSSSCDLQLWVDDVESFFCKFDSCEFDGLEYNCENIECQCQPGELLCGAEGSIDISEWLQKSVKGPGNLRCDESGKCTFEEPAMNQLIKFVFGDHSIELQCGASECIHYSQVPGYLPPVAPGASTRSIILSLSFAVGLIGFVSWALRRFIREDSFAPHKSAHLANEEPVASAVPVGLYFEKVRYTTASGKEILGLVSGAVPPGHVLAIMGGSGAGKTTLLDILAAKHKMGTVEGTVRLNGTPLKSGSPLRALVGFVDQSNSALVPTQTVFEQVMFSALLRLPRSMSRATKELRVLDTLSELGIAHLSQQLVGKGLSGGERRRVAIACELVTSPSVLLLDEPTSGLDAFSAFSVVETLVNLAKNSNRTVVFTIHQPRSNIVSLFDRILLLAQGQLVFTGTPAVAERHFADMGYPCPPNYNFADFIVDVSMKAALVPYSDELGTPSPNNDVEDIADEVIESSDTADLDENDVASGTLQVAEDVLSEEDGDDSQSSDPTAEDCPHPEVHTNPLNVDPGHEWEDFAYHRQQISRSAAQAMANSQLSLRNEGLEPLVVAFKSSTAHIELIEELRGSPQPSHLTADVRRATLLDQFKFISLRTFRNLYRDPMLVLTHYGISVGLGLLCGYLYFNVSNDIPGFQNRLGLFFFLLSVFGFSTLTSVSLFARERVIFLGERSNGYYHPIAYYAAKVLLDIVPLRIGPPLLLGGILYPLVGLNVGDNAPAVFMIVLTLFNLSAATIMLLIGILIADFGVSTLVGCMVNLFGILFAGLFLNQESMPTGSGWAKLLSIYHYAYEALSVNEVKYLTLTEDKFGLKIEVPGATILSAFGFNNEAVPRDIAGLAATAAIFLVIGYVALDKVLIERR